MNQQDHYLNLEFRIDRLRSLIKALHAFYDAQNEPMTIKALANLTRMLEEKKP